MRIPVVTRELRSHARRAATFRVRVAIPLLLMLFGLTGLLFDSGPGGPRQTGAISFNVMAGLAFVCSLLGGPLLTADAISSERRHGTLGLLRLTDLKPFDIASGKLAGASLSSLYALIASLPILAFPILAGGVSLDRFVAVSLMLLTTLLLSLTTGLFASTLCRYEGTSIGVTIAFLTLILVGLWPIVVLAALFPLTFTHKRSAVSLLVRLFGMGVGLAIALRLVAALAGIDALIPFVSSPLSEFAKTLTAATPPSSRLLRTVIPLLIALSGLLLLRTASLIGKPELDLQPAPPHSEAWSQCPGTRPFRAEPKIDQAPLRWLVSRSEGWPITIAIWTLFGLFFFQHLFSPIRFPGMLHPIYGHLLYSLPIWILSFLIAWSASRFYAQARATGSLESLLVTPLPRERFILAPWLRTLARFGKPLLVYCLLLLGAAILPFSFGVPASAMIRLIKTLLITVIPNFLAVSALAMWLGWSMQLPYRAAVRAFIVVNLLTYIAGLVLLPLAARLRLMPIPLVQFVIPLLLHGGIVYWSYSRLERALGTTGAMRAFLLTCFQKSLAKLQRRFPLAKPLRKS